MKRLGNALAVTLSAAVMFLPFTAIIGVFIAGIVGLSSGNLTLFWVVLIAIVLLVPLVILGWTLISEAIDPPLGAGSLDNPHKYGTTEWYRHENERAKYFKRR